MKTGYQEKHILENLAAQDFYRVQKVQSTKLGLLDDRCIKSIFISLFDKYTSFMKSYLFCKILER